MTKQNGNTLRRRPWIKKCLEYFRKVMSRKSAEDCALKSDDSTTAKCQDVISTNMLKSKAEKSKDNKLVLENESNISNTKRSKCQGKVKMNKEAVDVCNMQNKENVKVCERSDSAKDNAKEKGGASPSEKSKKYNAKEAKEKRNKEDTRNKNRGNEGNDIERNKEIVMPFVRSKEQLPEQGTQQSTCPILPAVGSLANEVAKARQHIKQSLQCVDDIARIANIANQDMEITSRIMNLERENQQLKNMFQEMTIRFDPWMKYMENIKKLETRLESLELRIRNVQTVPQKSEISKQNEEEEEEDDDDSEDIDLFGSDSEEEDAEVTKVREERLAAYAAKKSKKPALIAKSNIILDVKPWDDETDMKEMEKAVRKIETDGLLWGASKLVPLAFGIHKLQISCVVEDDKVSVDWLTERIQDIEDYVQSVDIAAFNKV
ncbi:probable elongation factor 1-delta isoform X2 [Ooceraea biroi]|uniref:probable elongation factor 1-delta isoform X2 n=1 Tax=Ooceraea biroi TaxID=2015173 RepID=UPI0005B8F02F|nr:probable elongation factor 1-delta isoform X2 [Ooceraea biroi]